MHEPQVVYSGCRHVASGGITKCPFCQIADLKQEVERLRKQLDDRHQRITALVKANANYLDAWEDNDFTVALKAKLARLVEGLKVAAKDWHEEAQEPCEDRDNYAINGAYQVCLHRVEGLLAEATGEGK